MSSCCVKRNGPLLHGQESGISVPKRYVEQMDLCAGRGNILRQPILILLFFLLFCMATAKSAFSSPYEIRLHRQAILSSGAVSLADVADVKTQDADQKSRLESLVVTQYSQAVKGASVGIFDITRALAQANLNPAAACIYGASYCRLTFNHTTLSNASPSVSAPTMAAPPNDVMGKSAKSLEYRTLADQLTRELVRLSGMEPSKLKVQWNCARPNVLDQKADEQRFVITPRSTATLGEVRFEVMDQGILGEGKGQGLSGTNGVAKNIRVYGQVEYLCLSVVARRCLKPGEVICAADVELRPRRVTSYRDIGVSDLDAVLGQEVARTIAAQAVVLPGMIRKLQMVKRHQLVDVYSRVGAVEVKTSGKALTNGAYGDTISVSCGPQKTIVQGKVTAPGEVTVIQKKRDTRDQVASAAGRNPFKKIIEREK